MASQFERKRGGGVDVLGGVRKLAPTIVFGVRGGGGAGYAEIFEGKGRPSLSREEGGGDEKKYIPH